MKYRQNHSTWQSKGIRNGFPEILCRPAGKGRFQLTREEFETIRWQREALENTNNLLRFQFETSKGKDGTRYLPYAFTEQGVAMLSGVLHSPKAVIMNIAIMRAFVEIRRMALNPASWKEQLKEITQRISEHDIQLSQIYDALENLLDENAAKRKWDTGI